MPTTTAPTVMTTSISISVESAAEHDRVVRFQSSVKILYRHVVSVTGARSWPLRSCQRRAAVMRLALGSSADVKTSIFNSAPGNWPLGRRREFFLRQGGGGQFGPGPGRDLLHDVAQFQQAHCRWSAARRWAAAAESSCRQTTSSVPTSAPATASSTSIDAASSRRHQFRHASLLDQCDQAAETTPRR